MKSLKHQIVFLLLGSLIILSLCLTLTLMWNTRERVIAAAIVKAKSDLATCTDIIDLTHPGDWQIRNGHLYKGDYQIGQDTVLVDHLSNLTGNSVTIFQNDTRISTTFQNKDGSRAIGTKVSAEVAEKVLVQGEFYLGTAEVLGKRYQTAYEPLRDANNNIVGMFYVGISSSYAAEMITNFLIQSGIIGIFITIAIVLAALVFLKRFIIKPLQDITLGTRDVATGHSTVKVNVQKTPKEIGDLAQAFNQLVEKMDNLTYLVKNGSNPSDITDILQPSEKKYPTSDDGETKSKAELEQDEWDYYKKGLPKGLNHATLKQIAQYLIIHQKPVSAEDVAEGVNLTRVTVRRYLEFLEQHNFLNAEMKYGTIGRPVKIFFIAPSAEKKENN